MQHFKEICIPYKDQVCCGKCAEITELYILWTELSRRKLSPALATAHYSCPDNAVEVIANVNSASVLNLASF